MGICLIQFVFFIGINSFDVTQQCVNFASQTRNVGSIQHRRKEGTDVSYILAYQLSLQNIHTLHEIKFYCRRISNDNDTPQLLQPCNYIILFYCRFEGIRKEIYSNLSS